MEDLPIRGTLPEWLTGTLLRNGPGKFETNRTSFRHWFDGQAMLHRFQMANGRVAYANRFLHTASAQAVRDEGRIRYAEFATDPCASLFGRFFTRFTRKATPNANVNIARVGNRFVAMTETTLPVEFDADTLRTAGVVGYDDEMKGQTTTAHPHQDPRTGELVNYIVRFSRSSEYRFYRQSGENFRREPIGSVPVQRPAYMHSFGVSERYAVLAEFPLVVNPLDLLLRGKPFIENYRWEPARGTRFIVMDLHGDGIRGIYETDAFFAFHHLNCWEDDGDLVVDICSYDDASIIQALYLDPLRANRGVPLPTPTRYRLDLDRGGVRVEPLAEEALELPRIAYRRHNGRPYRFAYGVSARGRRGDDFTNQLIKLDVETGSTRAWFEDGCYPGEPVFVERPHSTGEDDGVVLSVVLDARASRSYLLVLDAASYGELARAEVPHAIPFGFHGHFASGERP